VTVVGVGLALNQALTIAKNVRSPISYAHVSSICPTTFDVTKIARIVLDNALKIRTYLLNVVSMQHSRHALGRRRTPRAAQLRTKLSTGFAGKF
jgi:hypothetical protein